MARGFSAAFLSVTRNGLGKRGQTIFAEERWKTQVFAPWDQFPDFARASVFMRHHGEGFDPSRYWEYDQPKPL